MSLAPGPAAPATPRALGRHPSPRGTPAALAQGRARRVTRRESASDLLRAGARQGIDTPRYPFPAHLIRAIVSTSLLVFATSAAGRLEILAPPAIAGEGSEEDAAQALIREGQKYLEAGQVERATRDFERAMQMRPDDPMPYLYLARAQGVAKRFDEARKVLARAEIHGAGEKKLQYEIELVRGDLYRDEGNVGQARAAYQRAAGLRFFHKEARERLEALEAAAKPAGPQ